MSITEVYINTEQVNIYNQSTRQLIAEITVGTVNTTNTLEQEIANARHAKTVHRFLKKGIQKLEASLQGWQGNPNPTRSYTKEKVTCKTPRFKPLAKPW